MGSQSPAFSLLPPAPRYAGDKQAVGDVSQTPSEKQKFLVTAIGAGLLGPSPAHGWVWDGMPGALHHQSMGTGWVGLCLAWCHQSRRWKWGFGGRNCCCPHGPFSLSCNAKSWAKQGCGAPTSPRLLPTSHAASPCSGPTTSPRFPGKQKAFTFVRSQRQKSSRGKEKKKGGRIKKSEETVCTVLHR